ncbi:MAG: acylphosphatase [Fibrobacterales bacterium]
MIMEPSIQESAIRQYTILVIGKVQGVSFRYATHQKATQLNITGWVKNKPDESVLIVAQGTTGQLIALYEWCQDGPPAAIVASVTITEQQPQEHFQSFEIAY